MDEQEQAKVDTFWVSFIFGLAIGAMVFQFLLSSKTEKRPEHKISILDTEKW